MEVPYALPVINQPTPDGVPIYVPNPGLAVAGLSAATGVALARGKFARFSSSRVSSEQTQA